MIRWIKWVQFPGHENRKRWDFVLAIHWWEP